MRILVGGAGYLGGRVATALARGGHDVTAARRSTPASSSDDGIAWVSADLAGDDRGHWPWWVAAFDVAILCLPPRTPGYLRAVAAIAERASRGDVSRIVLSSSTGIYAEAAGGWVDEASVTDEITERGRMLAAAEATCLGVSSGNVTVLRFSGIYGPDRSSWSRYGRPNPAIAGPVRTPMSSTHDDPWTNRVHVADAVSAVEKAVAIPLSGIFNVTDNQPARGSAISAWIARRRDELGLGSDDAILHPPRDARGRVPDSSTDSQRRTRGEGKRVCAARLRASGWTPRYPSFQEGWNAEFAPCAASAEPSTAAATSGLSQGALADIPRNSAIDPVD